MPPVGQQGLSSTIASPHLWKKGFDDYEYNVTLERGGSDRCNYYFICVSKYIMHRLISINALMNFRVFEMWLRNIVTQKKMKVTSFVN